MDFLILGIEILVGFTIGCSLVKFLTVHPLKIPFFLSFLWGAILVYISVILISSISSIINLLLILLISSISFFLGYYSMTKRVLSSDDELPIPKITRLRGDEGSGFTAVIYLTHGEPETYNPIGWINQFKEFDELKTPFLPFLARPIFLYQLRKKYLKVGMSAHRKYHELMIHDLKKLYQNKGDNNTKFYLSFLDDTPDPVTATINAINDGASNIILSQVFVTNSSHTLEGEKLVKGINMANYGISLKITKPLWDSQILHQMFLSKLNDQVKNKDKSTIGVLLVGHGQPESWDVLFPQQTIQENSFREKIRDLLVENGYSFENIGLTWMEFRTPKPVDKIKEFVERGTDKIYYFAASISAEAIHSLYDIPDLIHASNLPDHVEAINLGAWNNHPLAIEAIKERIDSVSKDFL